MLLLDKEDIRSIFSIKDAIIANKLAFRLFSTGRSVVPLRTNIEVKKHGGTTLFMPGYVEDLDIEGVKIVSVFPENAKKGKPSVPATMVLVDSVTGEVCCILDGTYLTRLRTGAASGAATDILAHSDAKIGALIGIGGQALSQLDAMLTVRPLEEVRIYNKNPERTKAFIDIARDELGNFKANLKPVTSADDAIIDADIITAVTTSNTPVFDGKKIKKGAHINGVGSFMPHMQELDEEIIKKADRIYFDSLEAVLAESGDFIIPLRKGIINKNNFKGELGQVISGEIKGRESQNEITLFKTVGLAVQDVVTANEIYQKALKENAGYRFIFS